MTVIQIMRIIAALITRWLMSTIVCWLIDPSLVRDWARWLMRSIAHHTPVIANRAVRIRSQGDVSTAPVYYYNA
mgnify:CR=1 FL=1